MDERGLSRDEFIRKWGDCKSPEKILEINEDLNKVLVDKTHYWEFDKDKPCGCNQCNPKPIFESNPSINFIKP